ncbi:NUDIX domain-containing protein [Ferdinandcohnia sp. Marseille-Q9671]
MKSILQQNRVKLLGKTNQKERPAYLNESAKQVFYILRPNNLKSITYDTVIFDSKDDFMFFKRITYQILPEKTYDCTKFLNTFVIPIGIRNGAKLVGQWITESNSEIIAIWEYPNYDEYINIEKRMNKDKKNQKEKMEEMRSLILDYTEDYLSPTGTFDSPKHSVSVSGYITNAKQETLLVKTYWRSDTWELPGGGVDEGETLDQALYREIYEETGAQVVIKGVTGVYSNGSVVTIVLRGEYVSGNLTTSNETMDVSFVKVDESNIDQYIKRPKYKPRVLDAMKGDYVPYEAFKVRPYELLARLEGNNKNEKS